MPRAVAASIDVTIENPLRVYFADLHSHTSYSDGTLVPAVAHAYARDVAKLEGRASVSPWSEAKAQLLDAGR